MPTGGVVTGYLIMPPEKLMHLSRSILLDKDHLTRYFLRTSFLKNRNETFEKKPYLMPNPMLHYKLSSSYECVCRGRIKELEALALLVHLKQQQQNSEFF